MFTHWGFCPVATLERGNRYLNSNLVAFPNRMDGHMRFYADFVKSVFPPLAGLALLFIFLQTFIALHLLYRTFHLVGFTYPISILSKLQSNVASVAWHGSLVANGMLWWRILWARSCFMQETIYIYGMSFRSGRFTQLHGPFVGICLWLLICFCIGSGPFGADLPLR